MTAEECVYLPPPCVKVASNQFFDTSEFSKTSPSPTSSLATCAAPPLMALVHGKKPSFIIAEYPHLNPFLGYSVIASEDFVHRHGLENQAIEIVAQTITTDGPETFNSKDSTELMGANMSRRAADFCYKKSGAKPSEVGVCELHDCKPFLFRFFQILARNPRG